MMNRSHPVHPGHHPGRVMGLDVGDRTIGIALSDELGLTAQPFQTLKRKGDAEDLRAIRSIAAEHGVYEVVVGLPKNMDGTIGRQARRVMAFSEKIEAALRLPVAHQDERLSTVAAERVLLQADLTRAKRKKHVDKVAAVLILQGYLDSEDRPGKVRRTAGSCGPSESG
jgi:putative pre-16S rRNA nuclease